MRRVVITGLGPITAVGVGKKAFWEGMTNGKSGIGPVTRFDPSLFNARSAAEIMAYGYKRSGFGTVVGTPSAGAVSTAAPNRARID